MKTTLRWCVLSTLYIICVLALISSLCCSCDSHPTYLVGVSQCSDGLWRQRMNADMLAEQALHPEIELVFRQANDNSEVQSLQIDSFIHERVDLLIVAPNEEVGVTPAIARAFDAGIPVLVTDRRTLDDKWTAYIGGDNIQIGYLIGDWLLSLVASGELKEVRLMEIAGLPTSSPAVKRHQGMMDRIEGHPNIRLCCSACGRWLPNYGESVADSLLSLYPDINVIVAHNDEMAIGASRVVKRRGLDIKIMGVDAIPGPGGGLEALQNGDIDMSAANSGRGDLVLRLAARILSGQTFPRDTLFPSALIDHNAATGILMQMDLIDKEAESVRRLREELYELGTVRQLQRWIIIGMICFFILFVAFCALFFRSLSLRNRAREEQEKHEMQMRKQNQQLQVITAELAQTKAKIQSEEDFMKRLTVEIETHISDSDLDVDKLASQLGVSRTGLYRKIKAATGQSPVELIRHIRLHKAQQLIEEGRTSIQEIAFEVGFSTPSYFAKCYKDAFGESPTETLKALDSQKYEDAHASGRSNCSATAQGADVDKA